MNPQIFILDLDNTLFETRSIPAGVTADLFTAMRSANCGPDAVTPDVLELAFHDAWSMPFPTVAARHGLPQRLLSVWEDFHRSLTFPEPLIPFPDVVDSLTKLRSLQKFLCLLTSGYQRVQTAKIEALSLTNFFDLIVIDAVDGLNLGKERILADLMNSNGWKREEMLIIGDSAASEIAAGMRLGIQTVQIMRPGVIKTESANRHIDSLTELLADART